MSAVIALVIRWEFLWQASEEFVEQSLDYIEDHVDRFTAAWPNPLAMVEVAIQFFTGLPGLIVVFPFLAFERIIIQAMRDRKIANRLLTLESATRLAFAGFKEFTRNITFTDSSGFIGLIVSWSARFLWRLSRKIALLRLIVRAKSEAELVRALIRSFQRKISLARTIATVIGVSLILCFGGFICWTAGFVLYAAEGSLAGHLLSQDSKRTWAKRGRVVRVNSRRGPDFP